MSVLRLVRCLSPKRTKNYEDRKDRHDILITRRERILCACNAMIQARQTIHSRHENATASSTSLQAGSHKHSAYEEAAKEPRKTGYEGLSTQRDYYEQILHYIRRLFTTWPASLTRA